MYNGDQYRLMLDKSSFGNQLMKWAGQHFTPDQKQNIGAGREYGYSMMRKCLAQVGEQYTKIKCRPIDKVIYLEDVIIFEGIGTYEYHPFAALAFLSLLYGVMLTDDNRKEHHKIPDKADQLMNFLDDNFPEEAREIRNIVLCNDPDVSLPEVDADKYLDEVECSLHPEFKEALLRRYMNGNSYADTKPNITINIQEYVANKGDNYGTQIVNKDGGQLTFGKLKNNE